MFALLCAILLGQGLPHTIEVPWADQRMVLEKPSAFWSDWWKFMSIPPQERRAAFEKLPPDHKSRIMQFHMNAVYQRYWRKLSPAEARALSELVSAVVPEAFTEHAARERLKQAEAHLSKTLSRPALDEVQELLPPSKPQKATRAARKIEARF